MKHAQDMENVNAQNEGYLFNSMWLARVHLAFVYLVHGYHTPSSDMMAGNLIMHHLSDNLRNELLSFSLGMSVIQE